MTPGNVTLGIPGNPAPPKWQEPPTSLHWPDDFPLTGNQEDDFTADSLSDAKITCRRRNNNNIIWYYGQTQAAWMSSTSGHAFTMPRVPNACGVVGPLGGGTDGSKAEYSWMEGVLGPVCDALPTPEDHTQSMSTTGPQSGLGNPPGTMVLGPSSVDNPGVFAAEPGDTCAEGTTKKIPGPNGVTITLRKHKTPWGGYWEQIG